MGNNDISLLKYYFSAASQKNQKETADWMQRVSECLQSAGAEKIFKDEKKDQIFFQINNKKISGKEECTQYKIKISPGGSQITLIQTGACTNKASAEKLMGWYAAKRNVKLPKNIQYCTEPLQLKGKVALRDGWETELIRRTGEMNRIGMNDRKIFDALSRGIVPDSIQSQVRQEYQEYEREIRHGIDI